MIRGGNSVSQVPAGSLPRTMDVILRNDIVENVRAGDKVHIQRQTYCQYIGWCDSLGYGDGNAAAGNCCRILSGSGSKQHQLAF